MNILLNIGLGVILLDALLGWILFFSGRIAKNIFPIVLAATCSIVDEGLAHYFRVRFHNNLSVYYFFNSFEYALFAWFLYGNIASKIVRKLIVASIIIFISGTLVLGLVFVKQAYTDIYAAILEENYLITAKGLLLSIWSICYFKNLFDKISRYEYLDIYILLMVSGMLFYYAFSTVFFAAQNYLTTLSLKENPHLFTDAFKAKSEAFSYAYAQLMDVHTLLYLTNILLYLCIFAALFKRIFAAKKYSGGF